MEHSQLLRKRNSSTLQHFQICFHWHSFITGGAYQHFVKHDSNCPNIALFWVMIAPVGFRRHVLGRAYIVKHFWFIGDFFHLTVPKVNDGHLFALLRVSFEQNIIRFEVAVHYFFMFDARVSIENLLQNEDSLVFRETVWMLFDIVWKCPSFKQFHHHVEMVLFNDDIHQFYYVLVTRVL